MPEDPNALPNQPEEENTPAISQPEPQAQQTPAQPENVSTPAVSPPQAQQTPAQAAAAPSEQYPPSPSFYEQTPGPYGARPMGAPPPQMPPPGYGVPPGAPGMPPGYGPPPGVPPVMPPPGYVFVPVPPYGAPPLTPPPGYEFVPPPQPSNPLPLGQAVSELPSQYWRVLTRPGARTFIEEQHKAAWNIVLVQLLMSTLIALGVVVLEIALGSIQALTSLLSNMSTVSNSPTPTSLLPANFYAIEGVVLAILAPLVFLAGEGIQFGLAKMFRGTGSYMRQAYNHLLFYVPVQVITSIVSLFVLSLVARGASSAATPALLIFVLLLYLVLLGLGIYSIVLNVFSIMAAHRLTGGKASGVVLIPYGVLVLLYICLIAFVVVVALASIPR